MESLYSVQDTLQEFIIGDPRNGLTTVLDLNVLVNMTNLYVFDIHKFNAPGTLTTSNSAPLPDTITRFYIQLNNFAGKVDWSIFDNIRNIIDFRIFGNPLLTGVVDWNVVKNMFSKTGSNENTVFRIPHTGLSGNNADFIGLDLWWIDMDITYQCNSSIYCKEDRDFYSIDRRDRVFGRRFNILPECTCLCSNGTLTVISDLCPTTNFTWIPTASPTSTPSLTPSLMPSMIPSLIPTISTKLPTSNTQLPTLFPSMIPSVIPSNLPTRTPSATPLVKPTIIPTVIPTIIPTELPTKTPTNKGKSKTEQLLSKLVMVVICFGVIGLFSCIGVTYHCFKLKSEKTVKSLVYIYFIQRHQSILFRHI